MNFDEYYAWHKAQEPTALATKGQITAALQWKGTEACLDVHCVCGNHMHFDEGFLYSIRCGRCRKVFVLCGSVKLVEPPAEIVAWLEADEYCEIREGEDRGETARAVMAQDHLPPDVAAGVRVVQSLANQELKEAARALLAKMSRCGCDGCSERATCVVKLNLGRSLPPLCVACARLHELEIDVGWSAEDAALEALVK